MIFTKLLPDSRGIVSSFYLILVTILSIGQSQLTVTIEALLTHKNDNTDIVDYLKGGRINVGIYVGLQIVFFICVFLWQLRVALFPQEQKHIGNQRIRKSNIRFGKYFTKYFFNLYSFLKSQV